jgi:hypothetical protein
MIVTGARALQTDEGMTAFWFSCPAFTIQVNVDADGIIRSTAPIARRFIGQPLANLERWQKCKAIVLHETPDT